jgi:predicted membrane protein
MEGTALLIWGVIFGAVGLGFFTYGKRQQAIVPLISGIALFVLPYLISNVYVLVIAGIVFVVLPFFLKV